MPDSGSHWPVHNPIHVPSDMQNTEIVTECRYFLSILCPLLWWASFVSWISRAHYLPFGIHLAELNQAVAPTEEILALADRNWVVTCLFDNDEPVRSVTCCFHLLCVDVELHCELDLTWPSLFSMQSPQSYKSQAYKYCTRTIRFNHVHTVHLDPEDCQSSKVASILAMSAVAPLTLRLCPGRAAPSHPVGSL